MRHTLFTQFGRKTEYLRLWPPLDQNISSISVNHTRLAFLCVEYYKKKASIASEGIEFQIILHQFVKWLDFKYFLKMLNLLMLLKIFLYIRRKHLCCNEYFKRNFLRVTIKKYFLFSIKNSRSRVSIKIIGEYKNTMMSRNYTMYNE